MIELNSEYLCKKIRFVALTEELLLTENMTDEQIGEVVRKLFSAENDNPLDNPFGKGNAAAIAYSIWKDKQNDIFNAIYRLEHKGD